MTLRQLVIEFRLFKTTRLLDYPLTQWQIPEVNTQIYHCENIQSNIGAVCVWSGSARTLKMFHFGSSHKRVSLLLKAVITSLILEEDICLCRYCNISHTEKVSAQQMLSDTKICFEKDTYLAVIRTPQAGIWRMSLILNIIIKFNTSQTDDKKLEEKMGKRQFLIPDLFIRNSSCISTERVLVTSLRDTRYYRPVKRAHWKSTGNYLFRVYLYYFSSPFHPFAYLFCTSPFSSELWSMLHWNTTLNMYTLDDTVPSIKLSLM